jgi:hypothetical protein
MHPFVQGAARMVTPGLSSRAAFCHGNRSDSSLARLDPGLVSELRELGKRSANRRPQW